MKSLRKPEQKEALDGIESQLAHEPSVETRNRKRLRPNKLAEWELRVGNLRRDLDREIASLRAQHAQGGGAAP